MKIFILSMYTGKVNRGVETLVAQLSLHWSAAGNRVEVVSGGDSVLAFTLRVIPDLLRFKPDIVMPTNGGLQSLIIKVFSVLFGYKMVVSGQAGIGRDDKWNLLMQPDCFISPSVRGERWAKGMWFAKSVKITNIPNGVDLTKFSPKAKKIKSFLSRPIVLCVCSFEKYKRVELTAKAVARMKKGSLLLIGGTPNSKTAKFVKRTLPHQRVKIIKIAHEQIHKYYASADVFTLVSDSSEAFGIVYLEAMASNLPVVATDDELRRQIVGKAGILVDPDDLQAYTNALATAAARNWGSVPRKQAEKFSWDKIAQKYLEVFEQIL